MVLPLFNAILILIYYEKTKTNSWKTLRLLIGTFKRYLMIPKNADTSLVYEMIGVDIPEIERRMYLTQKRNVKPEKAGDHQI